MSVRKGDQAEGKLKVINYMRNLLKYTYERVKSDTFPKADRWIMAKAIWDAANRAHGYILRANGIRVETKEDAEERLLCEKLAIGSLDELIALIDTCYMCGTISADRCEFWTKLATDTQNLTKGWLKSQRAEYRDFLKAELGN